MYSPSEDYQDISLVAQLNTDEYASPGELYSSGSLYSNPGLYTMHGAPLPGGVVLECGGSDGMHPSNDSCTEPGPVYSVPFRRRDSGSRELSPLGNTGTNDGA